MLETGRILQERYRVEKQVGQGGMGSVYLATDERFHSTVAIKETLFGDSKLRKAFSREARLLNSLKHSALPKVSDHFVEDNGQYIVMEYIGGDDLFEMMRKSGQAFPVEDVLEWADQLLDALFYLHQQGIIHRDIKPQNLKLTEQRQIILLDFGLAKGNPSDANFQTAPHSIFGYSRNYASLEQIQGTGTDPRSDIYSLAATIYHLITGQVPADALTRVMMVLNENTDPLEPAGKFNPSISQEVSDALQVCLSLKAASRPLNVEETRELLDIKQHTPFAGAAEENATIAGREDLLTQSTKVFDRADGATREKTSELKTEVMGTSPESDSSSTVLANDPASTVSKKAFRTGRLGLAAAGATMFLIIGGVAATVVLWPLGGSTSPVGNSNTAESVKPLEESGSADILNSNFNGDLAGETLADEVPNTQGAKQTAEISPASTTDSFSKSEARDQPKVSKNNAPKSVGDAADSVTIKNGTVRTRDVLIQNDKGVVVAKSPPPVRDPILTREQLRKLTPAQRRRLLQKVEADRRAAELRRQEQLKQNPPPSTPRPPGP